MLFSYHTFLESFMPDDDGIVQAYVTDYGRKRAITSEPFWKRFLSTIQPIEFIKSQFMVEQVDSELLFRLIVGHYDLIDYRFEISDESVIPEIVVFVDLDDTKPVWKRLSDLWAHEIYSIMCESVKSQMLLINNFGLGKNLNMVEEGWERLTARYQLRRAELNKSLEYLNQRALMRQKVGDIIGYKPDIVEEPKLSVKKIRDLIEQERLNKRKNNLSEPTKDYPH
jgi:hypothetical protein